MDYNAWGSGLILSEHGFWPMSSWGRPKRNRAEIAERQLIHIEKHVEEMIDGHRALSPVYTESEIEELIRKTKQKWEPDIREKCEAIRLGAHKHWSFLYAVLGALSLTVGFALQLKAALT